MLVFYCIYIHISKFVNIYNFLLEIYLITFFHCYFFGQGYLA